MTVMVPKVQSSLSMSFSVMYDKLELKTISSVVRVLETYKCAQTWSSNGQVVKSLFPQNPECSQGFLQETMPFEAIQQSVDMQESMPSMVCLKSNLKFLNFGNEKEKLASCKDSVQEPKFRR